MKTFSSITSAFEWFLKNIYPNLRPDQKKGKLLDAWKNYTYQKGIAEKRMKEILDEFGECEVKTLVTFKPKE